MHAAALVRPLGIIGLQVAVERDLHLVDGLEPGAPAFDPEVLVEQGSVQPFDDAVGLRPLHLGAAVRDALQLQEQLVGVAVLAAAELAAIVGQYRLDGRLVRLEGRQHVVVEQLHGGERQLVQIQPGPGVAAVAVDRGLQVDLANALQRADEEGVDRHQGAGVRRPDMALAELRAEPLEQALGGGLLQAQQALVSGQQAVALPDPAHAAGRDLDAAQYQLLRHPQRTVAGMFERMVEDRLLDLGRHPVRVRALGAGQPVEQPVGAIGLEVAADLIELLARIAHQLAGVGDVAEVGGELQQRRQGNGDDVKHCHVRTCALRPRATAHDVRRDDVGNHQHGLGGDEPSRRCQGKRLAPSPQIGHEASNGQHDRERELGCPLVPSQQTRRLPHDLADKDRSQRSRQRNNPGGQQKAQAMRITRFRGMLH